MLEIKTIYQDADYCNLFDRAVNEALEEGWELVRREIVAPSTGGARCYAELERYTEEEGEDQMQLDDTVAEWVVSRNPAAPYRCSGCGASTTSPAQKCPACGRVMESYK